ncbi:MAG: hypothetical protein AAGD05_14035 [Bacteroidota bacterium]
MELADIDGSFLCRELPSLVNIGASYDFLIDTRNRITIVANFTSNSFSQDQIGGGLEYAFNEMFMLRGGYKYEFRDIDESTDPIYNGLSAGLTVEVPMKKGSSNRFGIDYAYRHTKILNGTHNLSLRISL